MELLAPAGDFERLVIACEYGADAVYLGGNALGLRAKAANFNDETLAKAVNYAHEKGVKVYVAANVFAHSGDFDDMPRYFSFLESIDVDALIVTDLGVFSVAKEAAPNVPVHISTQASVTNAQAAMMWRKLGAERVILARELSLAEIAEISRITKGSGLELEVFAHGAMCMAYSGRCLISNYLNARDANKGECSQPCRWKYHLMEETREGEYFPVIEDERGAFLFNSKDLRMVEHLDKLQEAGVASVKIEGRMKSPYYVASTVKAYRMAVDNLMQGVECYAKNMDTYVAETLKSSHREYCTGFFFGAPGAESGNYGDASYTQNYYFLGVVLDYDEATQTATVEQRNKFSIGDAVQFLQKNGEGFEQVVNGIFNESGELLETANRVQQIVRVRVELPVEKYDIMRARKMK